jgi:hypothetical protein
MIELEHRVNTLETNHLSFIHELKQTNVTLVKIELAIERQNEISTDIRLLRQEFKSHNDLEIKSTERQNARIEAIETTISRLNWLVITAVVGALMTVILKGN